MIFSENRIPLFRIMLWPAASPGRSLGVVAVAAVASTDEEAGIGLDHGPGRSRYRTCQRAVALAVQIVNWNSLAGRQDDERSRSPNSTKQQKTSANHVNRR
jgi:hypothetical protein